MEFLMKETTKKNLKRRIDKRKRKEEEGDDVAPDYWPIGAEFCKLSRVGDGSGSDIEIGLSNWTCGAKLGQVGGELHC
ncbi:hypothetical protein COLO4_29508 [Corchorus olitorius]|uniref:Uncharacterized protein n=1 Tax=Corchorus olitorius TaxID=93759 RepID=A0A1R3HE88_9ROSI|nr:hypothetical protein COLO4_29508 [Corchorus olitorius]